MSASKITTNPAPTTEPSGPAKSAAQGGDSLSGAKLAMLLLYGGTLFLSAILVFLIQLILGKMITPLVGGTPEVWNTCMVFFQAVLLAGYAYAHWSNTYLGPRRQAQVHLFLMFIPLLFLFPIGVNESFILTADERNPIFTVLIILLFAVGVPFFIVSASAPMLQKWFSSTDHPSAADPYFLYGASNLGSMGVLFAYPALIEPLLGISNQRWIWTTGYLLLFALTAVCAYMMWTAEPAKVRVDAPKDKDEEESETLSDKVTWGRRLHWILLAAVPSSLLLGCTTWITTDIAPIPLLWVLPLALYLATFIIVFAKTPALIQDWLVTFFEPVGAMIGMDRKALKNVIDGHKVLILILPLLVLLLLFLMTAEGLEKPKIHWQILLHLVALFVVCLVCHGELALKRPSAKYLTEFFMWMSFGGVVGGLLNSLVAPTLFNGYFEYSLVMVLACMLLPPLTKESESDWGLILDIALAGLFLLVGSLLMVLRLVDNDLRFAQKELADFQWHILGFFGLLVLGVWHIIRRNKERAARVMDLVLPLCLGLLTVGLIWGLRSDFLVDNTVTVTDPKTGQQYMESRLGIVTDWVNTVIGWVGSLINAKWTLSPNGFATILGFGLPAILCYTFVERSLRFGMGVAAMLIAGAFCADLASDNLLQERGFFGVLKVEQSRLNYRQGQRLVEQDRIHRLVHGTTLHGKQYFKKLVRQGNDEWVETFDIEGRYEPQTYYHLTGPIGQVCRAYNYPSTPDGRQVVASLGLAAGPYAGINAFPVLPNDGRTDVRDENKDPVYYAGLLGKLGVIGLGTGTMSTYAHPGQGLVFYDIDPLVKKISYDRHKRPVKDAQGKIMKDENGKEIEEEYTPYFSYVDDARNRGARVRLWLNDARLAVKREVADLESRARKRAEEEAAKSSGKADDLYPAILKEMRNREGYKILVVDAFSSDAIPIHLITLDALKLYMRYMRDDGIVCFHISNRWLQLEPVLANIVEAIRKEPNSEYPELFGLAQSDSEATRYGADGRAIYAPANLEGKASSSWVMIGRSSQVVKELYTTEQWGPPLQWDNLNRKENKDRATLMLGLMEASALPAVDGGLSGQSIALTLSTFLQPKNYWAKAPWHPLQPATDDPKKLEKYKKVGVWTDDYAPILTVFNWGSRSSDDDD